MDGPGGPPRLNDARTRRPDSPSRISRRTSPGPAGGRDAGGRGGSRPVSPVKPGSGGSYRPEYKDERDPRDIRDRDHRDPREVRRDVRDVDVGRGPAPPSGPGAMRLTLAERMGPRRGDSFDGSVSHFVHIVSAGGFQTQCTAIR